MNKEKKRVATFGVFDLLHVGHFNLIKRISEFGDLYIGLIPDDDVFAEKGKIPFYNFDERKKILELLDYDLNIFCVKNDELERKKWLYDNKIGKVIMGGDHKNHRHLNKICEELNIEYVVLNRTPDISSSEIKLRFL